MFDSYSELIIAVKSLDGREREGIKLSHLSVCMLCALSDALIPTLPLSLPLFLSLSLSVVLT